MKAIILAAGRGTRISRYLSGRPKCTVNIGDESLIEYTVKLLQKKGVTEIAIVVGYSNSVIRELLKDYNVKFYENPFYDVTNSIASLWFAKEFLQTDERYIIMNGDVFVEEELMEEILHQTLSPVMYADESRKECADYKFKYEDGILKKYGKDLRNDDISGEYIGIGSFDFEFLPVFIEHLEMMIYSQQHDVWWENVIYNMSDERNIYVCETGGKFWAEVDYIEDYERILNFRGCRLTEQQIGD